MARLGKQPGCPPPHFAKLAKNNLKATEASGTVASQSTKTKFNSEIIGWVLANWRQGFVDESIKSALQEATCLPIGKNNQKKIKDLIKQYSFIKS